MKQVNKPHKGSKKRSSSTSKTHRVEIKKLKGPAKREERLNQADQIRKLKKEKVLEEKRKLGVESQPPILIGVLDLGTNSCSSFFKNLENDKDIKAISDRVLYVVSNRLKMRFRMIALDSTKFDETLDVVKTLDILMLLHKVDQIEDDFDFETSSLLRAIHIHCLPTIIHVLDASKQGTSAKQLISSKRILRSSIKNEDEKMHCIERDQDYMQLFNIIGNCKRKKSLYKESRATVVCDKVEVIGDSLAFLGYVRHKCLSPNDLVHVVGYDDYQIRQIDILPDIAPLRATSNDSSSALEILKPDQMRQETLETENELDPMEGEQTWPTAEEIAAEVDRLNTKKVIKRLPVGTSDYQGAWIFDEDDDDDADGDENNVDSDDGEDAKMREISEEGEGSEGENHDANSDDDEHIMEDESDANHAENGVGDMEVEEYDKNNPKSKEMKILEKLREARLEEMFPDEIDSPSDVTARSRFARYRGLKSFKTSPWDPQENLPSEYSRIYQFKSFQQTKNRVMNEFKEGAEVGYYVRIHLADLPKSTIDSIVSRSLPPILVGLLKYERKMTVMNYLIKRIPDSNLNNPIKSKDELIFHVGFRKFKARPLFTTHSLSSKFKYERFLKDDVAMVATTYAPITFPPAPVLVFRQNYRGEQELVASGSVLDSNPNRLIIKRIRLSGHPFKIYSKTAVIRFMFFNSEDVHYFKPVELTSKYNRRGHISEPLGTHGHMKCTFDKKIRSDDCIFMNLYKRVFPKWTYKPINKE